MKASRKKMLGIPIVAMVAMSVATACTSSGGNGGSGDQVVVRALLAPNTGQITSKLNTALNTLTKQYEAKHPKVSVQWQPNPASAITAANSTLISQAAGGSAPDIVWEQYNPLLSGSIPKGILQDLRPWLNKPNPYVKGNKKWLDTFEQSTIPYMTSPDGSMQILLGSNVETAFFYSKSAFAKAKIASPPVSWAEVVTDLGKLKGAGFTPLMFGTGGICNPSWYERLASTQFLTDSLSKFLVDKSQVTSGADVVSGIEKGIISMKNPAYAAVWKTLYDLRPYLSKSGSSYDACSTPNTVSPPLSPQPAFVQGKVAMLWGGSWFIPELNTAGFSGKYGLFAEPPITKETSKYSAGISTKGVIGGPNGPGQWSITSQKADKSMTSAKTDTVMDFMAWLYAPANIGAIVKSQGEGGADIPTVIGAPVAPVPGLASLVPAKAPKMVVDIALDDVLSTNTTNAGLRLLTQLLAGGVSFSSFSSQWDALLVSGAQTYAQQNHIKFTPPK